MITPLKPFDFASRSQRTEVAMSTAGIWARLTNRL